MAKKYQVYSRIGREWVSATKKEYDEASRYDKRIMKSFPKQNKAQYKLVFDVMHSIQDDYNLKYPTTANIIRELKKRGYNITKSNVKDIKKQREEVKWDIEHQAGARD